MAEFISVLGGSNSCGWFYFSNTPEILVIPDVLLLFYRISH
jgi:hypothetical protein